MAKDIIHDAVKNALIKDGWTITHDPYTIGYKGKYAYADLAAERPIAAQRGSEKIIVEIKSFVGMSILQDFKTALGSYSLYLPVLAQIAPEYQLFLAVDHLTYQNDFQHPMVVLVMESNQIPFIVVNTKTETINQWIP